LNFLELSYNLLDKYILILLKNFKLSEEVSYTRYNNILFFCTFYRTKDFLNFIFKNFILYYLYYCLQLYLYYYIELDFKVNYLKIFGYIFFLLKDKIKIKLDNYKIVKLLSYYNLLQIIEKKIFIKISQ